VFLFAVMLFLKTAAWNNGGEIFLFVVLRQKFFKKVRQIRLQSFSIRLE